MKNICLVLNIYFLLAGSVRVEGAVWGSAAEEAKLIEQVKAHPEIDYALCQVTLEGALLTNGGLRLVYKAAHEDYTNLLAVVEQQDRAVSRYETPEGEQTPMDLAFAGKAFGAVELFARLRPDWLNPPPSRGTPPIILYIWKNDIEWTRKLLDWGANVDSRGVNANTPMEMAGRKSLEMYELIRGRGGKCSFENRALRKWDPEVRNQVIEKYRPHMCHLISNRLELATGEWVAVPPKELISSPAGELPFPSWRELTSDERYQLEKAFRKVGEQCGGTVLLAYHDADDHLFIRWSIIPILEGLNLVGIFIPPEGDKLPFHLKNDSFPLLPPLKPADGEISVPLGGDQGK